MGIVLVLVLVRLIGWLVTVEGGRKFCSGGGVV